MPVSVGKQFFYTIKISLCTKYIIKVVLILYSFTPSDINFKQYWCPQVILAKMLSQKIYSLVTFLSKHALITSIFLIGSPSQKWLLLINTLWRQLGLFGIISQRKEKWSIAIDIVIFNFIVYLMFNFFSVTFSIKKETIIYPVNDNNDSLSWFFHTILANIFGSFTCFYQIFFFIF